MDQINWTEICNELQNQDFFDEDEKRATLQSSFVEYCEQEESMFKIVHFM